MELKPWHLLLDGSFATLQPKFTHRSLAKPPTLQVYSIACVSKKCLLYGSQVLNTMKDNELDGCRNLSFGLATEAKGLQGRGPRGSPGVTSHTLRSVRKCEGVNPHTPKATPTLGDGVQVDSQNFREQFEGSKLNVLWRSLYHWKALGT